jgi:outer membrane protein assembly factor BamD
MSSAKSRHFVALLLFALLGSCSAAGFGHGKGKTAEELFNNAVDDLNDHLYPEALSGFADVKSKYPYSKFAALADLKTGDTHFKSGKYAEAVDAYREFIKLHPNHDEVPYAMFRIGETYFEQLPSDFVLMPPAEEKDQANTRLAITAYQELVDRFPKADYADKARQKLGRCKHLLAEHELYVAQFYWRREKWSACANRAEALSRDYAGIDLEPTALLLAARARQRSGEPDLARASIQKLVERYPGASETSDAKKVLAELPAPAAAPAAPVAPAAPATAPAAVPGC